MRDRKMTAPLMMGAMMGLMLPWMLHSGAAGQSFGLGFLMLHLGAILLAAATLLLAVKAGQNGAALRRALARHRPQWAHVGLMGVGLTFGLGATCLLCLGFYAEGL
jgi:hypothetical protein